MSGSDNSDDDMFAVFEGGRSASIKRSLPEEVDELSAENQDDVRKRAEELMNELMEHAESKRKKMAENEVVQAESSENVKAGGSAEFAWSTGMFDKSHANVISIDAHETYTHQVAVPPTERFEGLLEATGPAAIKFDYKLDPFQAAAVRCIENDHSVLVSAHTSAGKTAIAYYAIAHSLRQKQRVIYTSPIKALSNQKFREFCERFSDVGLLTGDISINPTAACLVMTTEILRSMLYHGSEVIREIGWVIFDEIHYMRDRERGVVWEEAIILLPDSVRQVFLSATIPNGAQFAEWVSVLHKQVCHVISTDRRPVPLQHYVYPAGGDGIYLIYESSMEFSDKRFNEAVRKFSRFSHANVAGEDRRPRKSDAGGSNLFKLISLILHAKLTPVIVFCFSRRECEANAIEIYKKIDFNSAHEKKLVDEVFTNAVALLSEGDQKLTQISSLLPMLRRGVGIHHSGLLPVMKETIEILFSEGLIKGLFATETFSMGLNMPAKTVLFMSVRKFDGTSHRWITSGEYIQMSGRAGRRGLDNRGLVIMIIDTMISADVAKAIVMGKPDPLNSQFRLTYNMVLNLLRVEGIDPEFMLERSFSQFQNCHNLPMLAEKVKQLQMEYDRMEVPNEQEVSAYQLMKGKIKELHGAMLKVITKPIYLIPFIQAGRLIRVAWKSEDFGWCVVVNYHRKFRKNGANSVPYYVIDTLMSISPSCGNAKVIEKVSPPRKGEEALAEVIPIFLECITGISSVRIYYSQDLRDVKTRKATMRSVQEVAKRFPESQGGIPLLDPIEDMRIEDEKFKENVKHIEQLEKRIAAMPIKKRVDFETMTKAFDDKVKTEELLKEAKKNLVKSQRLLKLDELRCRKRVLRRLGYCTAMDVITLKGRVACEISAGNELLLTELLFDGRFADLDPPTCAALLSCVIFEENAEAVELSEEYKLLLLHLQRIAKRIVKVSKEVDIEIDENEYLATIKPQMMSVVHAWCCGKSFDHISSLTTVFEGSIVRTMRRLEELLREMCLAAKAMGNDELEKKFADACVSIRRDIIFAPSLYL